MEFLMTGLLAKLLAGDLHSIIMLLNGIISITGLILIFYYENKISVILKADINSAIKDIERKQTQSAAVFFVAGIITFCMSMEYLL